MMNSLLFELFKKPEVYAPTPYPFWDDAHISRQMLKAHLDPNFDGASRRHDVIDQSVRWIDSVLKESGKKILDLGCGPGLYCERFARLGYQVTGIDYSYNSIDYARRIANEKGLKIDYEYQDYLAMEISDKFDCILLIFCDYGVLSPKNRLKLLENAHRAMKPGGKIILDCFTQAQFRDRKNHTVWHFYPDGDFWSEKRHICLDGYYQYDDRILLDQVIVITDEDSRVYYLWNTVFTTEEIQTELDSAGFSNVHFYDNVCGAPLSENSPTICVLAEK